MTMPITALNENQTFRFACSSRVACFNACCRDLNQVLTPYDILCLKQFLGLSSREFLDTYTQESVGPESGLPVVSLRFEATDDLACPFVSDSGCRVYPARPASCRTYPLARGVSRDRSTGRLTEHWALIREPHCLGFTEGDPQTVDAWVTDQRIATHNRMNDMMLELISLKHRLRPGPLRPADRQRFYTALYDLDTFRHRWFGGLDAAGIDVDPQILEKAKSADRDLLVVAMAWVRQTVLSSSAAKQERGR